MHPARKCSCKQIDTPVPLTIGFAALTHASHWVLAAPLARLSWQWARYTYVEIAFTHSFVFISVFTYFEYAVDLICRSLCPSTFVWSVAARSQSPGEKELSSTFFLYPVSCSLCHSASEDWMLVPWQLHEGPGPKTCTAILGRSTSRPLKPYR